MTSFVITVDTTEKPLAAGTVTVRIGETDYTVTLDAQGHGTCRVTNPETDDVYIDEKELTAKITAFSKSLGFQNALTGTETKILVEDTIDTTELFIVANTAASNATELVFDLSFDSAPESDVNVFVSYGSRMHKILVHNNHGELRIERPKSAFDNEANITLSPVSVIGDTFENLEFDDVDFTVATQIVPVTASIQAQSCLYCFSLRNSKKWRHRTL